MSELRATLEDLNLQEYFNKLFEYGFDTWDSLIDIKETDMAILGIKLGHRRRLQREIVRRLGYPDNEPLLSSHTVLPLTDGQHGRADAITHSGRPKRRYKQRPRRDPHAPKRPDTGYVAYAKFLRQDPGLIDLSFVEIAKLVGDRWSNLSSGIKAMWNGNAAAQRVEYKSAIAQYHQTEEYQAYCNGPKSKQPAPVKCSNALVENCRPKFESDVSLMKGQAAENLSKSLEIANQVGSECAPSNSTTSSSTARTVGSTETSPSCYRSSYPTSICESLEADLDVPVIESVWRMVSQEQASNPLPAQLSRDDLFSYSSQRSAPSKSFHIQSINPFDFQSRATIWPIIDSFLQNVNTVYYLINPDALWSYLDSILDTNLETPNLIISIVCICIALGCQTCPAGTMDMAIMWYENGRRYLDDYDWGLDPTVVQILALISMFHMAQRPATSSHYLDAAIRIGEANRLYSAKERCNQIESCWDIEWQDIWNTLKTMHRILLLGCGANESILPTLQTPLSDITRCYGTTTSQLTVATCAFNELSDILGSIQQQLDQRKTLPLWRGNLFSQRLEMWLQCLPDHLSLPTTSRTSCVDQSLMTGIFSAASDAHKVELLHLYSLYFGIIGLLKRLSLQQIVSTNAKQTPLVVGENEANAYECLNAAFQLIDLYTAFSRASPFPVYAWLPQCVLFTSSLDCALGIVWQRQLLAQDTSASCNWLDRTSHSLHNMLQIFKHCGTGNAQAKRHYLVLLRILEWLQGST